MSEDEEWFLIRQIATAKEVLKLLPKKRVAAARKRKGLKDMPVDVLAVILSHVRLCDVKHVRRVNKTWFEATNKPQFWKKLIKEKLDQVCQYYEGVDNPVYRDIRKRLDQIDFFFSVNNETIPELMGWLFIKTIKASLGCRYSSHQVEKYNTSNQNVVSYAFRKSDNKLMYVKLDSNVLQKLFVVRLDGSQPKRLEFQNGNATITWIDDDGTMFNGCGVNLHKSLTPFSQYDYTPHGDGKWTFPDGTVIEGKGVAWEGEPRLVVKRQKI